ncbi:MAG: hypothetical protein FJX74_26475 [Armatimonadetes bacterium]|nr:hypothetical protein [Armatimonadota bacterium]
MTGRERTLRALSFQSVDRAPVAGGLLNNWELLAEIAEAEDFWAAPRRHLLEAFRRLGCDAILGPVMPKRPEEMTEGPEGRATGFSKVRELDPVRTPEEVARRAEAAPPVEEVRGGFGQQAAYDEYVRLMVDGQREAGDMLLIPHCLGYAPWFPTSSGEFDYEAFLMACALYPEPMAHLFRSRGEQSRLRMEAVAQATGEHDLLPLLWTGTDLCGRNGPMLSPALLERLYFPVLARALEPLRQAGMRVIWHCDANYRAILPQMIALGIDGFQGLYEEEGGVRLEDLARMSAATGDPLIVFGSVLTWGALSQGTPEDVRRDVNRCRAAVRQRGGLLLAPSSSIGPEAPSENVLAMYEHARTLVS